MRAPAKLRVLIAVLIACVLAAAAKDELELELAQLEGPPPARVVRVTHDHPGCTSLCPSVLPNSGGKHVFFMFEVELEPTTASLPVALHSETTAEQLTLRSDGDGRYLIQQPVRGVAVVVYLQGGQLFGADVSRFTGWDAVPSFVEAGPRLWRQQDAGYDRVNLGEALLAAGGERALFDTLVASLDVELNESEDSWIAASQRLSASARLRLVDLLIERGAGKDDGVESRRLRGLMGVDESVDGVGVGVGIGVGIGIGVDPYLDLLAEEPSAEVSAFTWELLTRLITREPSERVHYSCCDALELLDARIEQDPGARVFAGACLDLLAARQPMCGKLWQLAGEEVCGSGASVDPDVAVPSAVQLRAQATLLARRTLVPPEHGLGQSRRDYALEQRGRACSESRVGQRCRCAADLLRAACALGSEQTAGATEACSFEVDDVQRRIHDVRAR